MGVLYFQNDSCKNFSLDSEVGVRYMITKNIGAFIEFKYIKQWDVELGVQHLTSNGQRWVTGRKVRVRMSTSILIIKRLSVDWSIIFSKSQS